VECDPVVMLVLYVISVQCYQNVIRCFLLEKV